MKGHKKYILLVWSVFLLVCTSPAQSLQPYPFASGEKLTYKISYGWITLGEGQVTHEYPLSTDTFRIDVVAYTTGIISWIARLNDTFRTTLSKETLLPVTAFTDRKEGKDLRKELNYFDYNIDSAHMLVFDEEQVVREKRVAINDSVYDMLSSYAYLRTRAYDDMEKGDSLMIKTYYEGQMFDFGVEYIGKTRIPSILGEVDVDVMYILFPISGTFPKKHMIRVWVTADDLRVPLYIEAQMKFGKARCELVEYVP